MCGLCRCQSFCGTYPSQGSERTRDAMLLMAVGKWCMQCNAPLLHSRNRGPGSVVYDAIILALDLSKVFNLCTFSDGSLACSVVVLGALLFLATVRLWVSGSNMRPWVFHRICDMRRGDTYPRRAYLYGHCTCFWLFIRMVLAQSHIVLSRPPAPICVSRYSFIFHSRSCR